MLSTSGTQNVAKKRYTKCTLCLGLVSLGAGATSYKRLVQVNLIFSTFSVSYSAFSEVLALFL